MKIVWDLDGVVRDLNGYLTRLYGGAYPTTWNWKYNEKTICQCINANLDILKDAPPTAYYRVMQKHFKEPEIWTSQPPKWQANTIWWLDKHIGTYNLHFLTCEEKEERLYKEINTLLVEDNPNFKSYDRIIRIDRPYNQEIKSAMRIFGTRHLNNMIELIKVIQ